jgi:hypothetical protein
MTESQLKSLYCFDDEWRSGRNLKSHGVNELDLPYLVEQGYVIGRQCGTWAYQITDAGRQVLKKSGQSATR